MVGAASQIAFKNVRKILPASRPHWVGNGFNVYPVFAQLAFTQELSPWLMFDYAAPKAFPPTRERLGVGQHPHRGFETVTIAFQGEVEHSDSVGHNDVIGPGDVQWMTAGRGIIHEEYHSTAFAKSGGTFEMCQLWVNLPRKDKMVAPRYQPILNSDIPVVPLEPLEPPPSPPPVDDGKEGHKDEASCEAVGSVRVIAGEFNGQRGPAATFSPVELWDVDLPTQKAPVLLTVPEGHNAVIFVRSGELTIGVEGSEQRIGPQGVALMEREGQSMRVTATKPNTKLLLLGGEPLNEPIAARGPFVMSTQEEILQANRDFHAGKMGE